jgi:CubicO group peptidase (beta-lactamase class C family)
MNDLNDVIYKIQTGDFGAIDSLLVWQKGNVLSENYFRGYDAHTLHEAQSVTKSIQSLLVGNLSLALSKGEGTKNLSLALSKGEGTALSDFLDLPIYPFFKEYENVVDWSNGKQDITIRHLLTMTAGYEWNEADISYSLINENHASLQVMNDDWILFPLEKPMIHSVGQVFTYSSANTILLSQVIRELSGMSNELFAQKHLLEPLGIQEYAYYKSPKYPEILADIYLKPQDLLKIGILVLQEGVWEGKQLISKEWLKLSTQIHVPLSSAKAKGYGLSWWLHDFEIQSQIIPCVYAWGIGGQYIFMFKDLEAVIIFTGDLYDTTLPLEPFEILEQSILPFLLHKKP